ncbi:hypothetical protein NrS5_23 [Nitratiruptor phage NrS-5]|uniref:helix-turn-helix domain-containing protein n=1 Tax=unclassified Nitratiruptor TaxID=2624044 RepID=UPI0019169DE7|nr:hypothetical protein NitYY0813_C0587 [Nitratiruptor sp. YY08-13]BCD65662.1 hypothetical protein NitYY0826_C0589 [Nitratiruptor sp. YY08-26]BCD83205.1 hypothetical protein NrS4_23 [Nitratiruptor phage NrS-4]BCD83264.1 hypothetical protein NrS5_23 [Nitratiruptor phage NrS-5]
MNTFQLEYGTITNIAKKCHVTHSAVSQWFNGDSRPSLKNIIILRDEFGIPVEAWLDIKSYLNHNSSSDTTSRINEAKNQPKVTS